MNPTYQKKVLAYLDIIRPFNCLMTGVFMILAVYLGSGVENIFVLFVMGITGSLFLAVVNITNDIADEEIDRINQPDRAIPSGIISRKEAVVYAILVIVLVELLSILIDIYLEFPYTIIIGNILIVPALLYNFYFKKWGIFGNIIVAGFAFILFLYGDVIDGELSIFTWGFGVTAFALNLAREIIKGIADEEGDRKYNIQTLAVKYGVNKAKIVASIVLALSVIPTLIIAADPIAEPLYWKAVVVLFNLMTLFHIIELWRLKKNRSIRRIKHYIMLQITGIAIFAFVHVLIRGT